MKALVVDPDSEKKVVKLDDGKIRLYDGAKYVKYFESEESNARLPLIAVVKWFWKATSDSSE